MTAAWQAKHRARERIETESPSATAVRPCMKMTSRMQSFVQVLVLCALVPASSLGQAQVAATPVEDALALSTSTFPEAGTSVEWARAEGVIDAPLDQVMAIVQNYGQYASFLPNFKVSRVLSQRGASANVYMEVGILHGTVTIWAQLALRAKPSVGETRVVEARMTEGNVDRMNARWEITPLSPTRTKVAFQMLLDPDLPVPSSLVTEENAKAVRRTIRALRKRLLDLAPTRD